MDTLNRARKAGESQGALDVQRTEARAKFDALPHEVQRAVLGTAYLLDDHFEMGVFAGVSAAQALLPRFGTAGCSAEFWYHLIRSELE